MLWALICVSGCASWPSSKPPTPQIGQEGLSSHVRFLAHPNLKGRGPRSGGSASARRYIEQRFTACGLVPWGRAQGFSQSFFLGTNVIGVLPGSDPNLAKEYVILAAHYDHLGRTKQGLCLGACDNASGVAALLEIAEELALAPHRPRRSVCFAAIDQEEKFSLGALALTCRQDYDPNRIAGVVNLDMLGRHGFEVLDRHLFVVGTESYPDLRRHIRGLAGNTIKVLPVGTDIVGPRGDHVVFEPLAVPTLFFTCSLYKDYHRPGDTEDKLDYEDLRRSMRLACDTVRLLADNSRRYTPIPPSHGDVEEMEALHLCLGRVLEHPERMDLTPQERLLIKGLVEKTARILQENDYSLEDRRRFLWWQAGETLLPLMARFEQPPAPAPRRHRSGKPEPTLNGVPIAIILQRTQFLASLEGREAMIEGGQAFVRHMNKARHPLLWGVPKFEWIGAVLPDRFISLEDQGTGQYSLNAATLCIGVKHIQPPIWIWPVQPMKTSAGFWIDWIGFEGTKEDLIDTCLLRWGAIKKVDFLAESLQKILCRVTDTDQGRTYQEWLTWRLAQGPWPDEKTWIINKLQGDNRHVARQAFWLVWHGEARPEAEPLTCAILVDPNRDPCVRIKALDCIITSGGLSRQTLLALAEIVDDTTPIPQCGVPIMDPYMTDLATFANAWDKKPQGKAKDSKNKRKEVKPPATLGEKAQWKLKALTKKDFGKDRDAWVRWIERHRR